MCYAEGLLTEAAVKKKFRFDDARLERASVRTTSFVRAITDEIHGYVLARTEA